MTSILDLNLADGGSLLVEVDDAFDRPAVRGRGSGTPAVIPSDDALEDLLAGIGPVTNAVMNELRTSGHGLTDVEVEFAIRLTAQARVVIVRAGAQANFRITARWSAPREG